MTDRPRGEAGASFDRAVARERDAIGRHDLAARCQDQWATQLEQHALDDQDDALRDAALVQAEHARERAASARDRAAFARARLAAEGVDPEG